MERYKYSNPVANTGTCLVMKIWKRIIKYIQKIKVTPQDQCFPILRYINIYTNNYFYGFIVMYFIIIHFYNLKLSINFFFFCSLLFFKRSVIFSSIFFSMLPNLSNASTSMTLMLCAQKLFLCYELNFEEFQLYDVLYSYHIVRINYYYSLLQVILTYCKRESINWY